MNSYIEGSVIYRPFLWFGNIYKNSLLKKIFSTIGVWYSSSRTHKIIFNYLNRKSSYQYTITYRFLSAIGKLLDIPVGIIHNFFAAQLKSSRILFFFSSIKKEAANSMSPLLIAVILSLTAGYSIATTILNKWSTLKIEGALVLCAVCIILGVMSGKWKASLKNSFFIKLYHFIWE